MDIGPISGIGAVPPVQTNRTVNDLSGVFRVEFQREQQDSYAPNRQGDERGLEDEDEAVGPDEALESELLRAADAEGSGEINVFA